MIQFAQIKATLSALIADVADVPPASVYWLDESAASSWMGEPSIGLRISSVIGQGIEEELRSTNADANLTVTLAAQVRFTLSVTAQSFTQDIADPQFAGNVARRVTMGLALTTSQEQMAGLCAVERKLAITPQKYVRDGRQVSSYTVDLLMRTVDNHVDTSVNAGGFINEVVIDGQTVNNAAGPIPQQPHLDVVGDA